MKQTFLLVAAAFTGMAAQAQTDTASLNEVVVTASRFEQKQAASGKVVTIINAQQLSRSSGKTLTELLNQQAGISIIGAQNNLGTNQDVYMRGAATGQTLILIDGMPAYDPSTISTAFDLNHFAIENIERIEIVRGAMSTLYGSDAVAGVINIITKKSGPKPLSFYGTAAGGSFGTFKGVAGLNGHTQSTRYNVQYSHLGSKGFSSAYDSTGKADFDRDGYQQNILSASVGHSLAKNLLVKAAGSVGKYETDLDAGAFGDEKDFTASSRNIQAGAGLEYQHGIGKLFFNFNHNSTERKYLDDSIFVGGFSKFTRQRYTGRSNVAELYSSFDLGKNLTLLAGTDYRFQNTNQLYFSVSSFGPYETKQGKDSVKMNQYSLFATAQLKSMGGFQLEVGGRYNKHSFYGSNATYTFNPSYLINDKLKLFANVASAFKAPSLYQLYVVGAAQNNPLKAEKSETFDGGIEYNSKAQGIFARLVYFNRRIKNGIEYNLVNYTYFNNNLQKDHGFEAEAGLQLDKWDVAANYSYVTGKVNTAKFVYDAATFGYKAEGDTTYNNIFRRPENSFNLTVGLAPVKDLYVSAHTRIVGKRLEPLFQASPIEMEGYHTIDLYASYQVCKAVKGFVDLKNITNERFFDVRGYNARRFNFMAGVNFSL
jgi:vitamin B12 transporter